MSEKIIVKNIKLSNHEIKLNNNSLYKELLDDDEVKVILKNHINHQTLSFNVYNVYPSFINGIRRVIETEMNIYYFSINDNDIITNDRELLKNYIISQLEMICINQDIPLNTKFNLSIENNTTEIKDIYTSDLIPNNKNNIKYFNKNIIFLSLNPGKKIELNNVYIVFKKVNKKNTNKLCISSYKDIDIISQTFNKSKSNYEMFIESNGINDIKQQLQLSINVLIDRLKKIKSNIELNINDNNFNITQIDTLNTIFIRYEKYTIPYLIQSYARSIKKDVVVHINHPSDDYIDLIFNYDKKIIIDIIEIIINDFIKFNNNFD